MIVFRSLLGYSIHFPWLFRVFLWSFWFLLLHQLLLQKFQTYWVYSIYFWLPAKFCLSFTLIILLMANIYHFHQNQLIHLVFLKLLQTIFHFKNFRKFFLQNCKNMKTQQFTFRSITFVSIEVHEHAIPKNNGFNLTNLTSFIVFRSKMTRYGLKIDIYL